MEDWVDGVLKEFKSHYFASAMSEPHPNWAVTSNDECKPRQKIDNYNDTSSIAKKN